MSARWTNYTVAGPYSLIKFPGAGSRKAGMTAIVPRAFGRSALIRPLACPQFLHPGHDELVPPTVDLLRGLLGPIVEVLAAQGEAEGDAGAVSYTHLRAHETDSYLVCRLL